MSSVGSPVSPMISRKMLVPPMTSRAGTPEEFRAYVEPLREPARARASVQIYRTFQRRDLRESRRRSRPSGMPALLVMGEASIFHRVLGDTGVRTEIIPRAGHFLAEEKPEEILRVAEEFL